MLGLCLQAHRENPPHTPQTIIIHLRFLTPVLYVFLYALHYSMLVSSNGAHPYDFRISVALYDRSFSVGFSYGVDSLFEISS